MSDTLASSFDAIIADYDRLRDDVARVQLDHISLIMMTGEDRKGWLQGQVTQDLREFNPGSSASFCFCDVGGHVVSVCQAWALPDRVLITCPRETEADVLNRVRQMVIMEDVLAVSADSDYRLVSLQGPSASRRLSELTDLPSLDAGTAMIDGVEVVLLRSDRTGLGGWEVWAPRAACAVLTKLDALAPSIMPEAYDVARLEAGFVRYGADVTAKSMPPEMGAQFVAKHVSYSKGCYMGQEVLMRIHSRGHTNRTWVGLRSDELLPVGSPVRHTSRPDAGVVTSAGVSPDYGPIAGAMVRNEVAYPGEIVTVTVDGRSVEAEVRMMPILRLE